MSTTVAPPRAGRREWLGLAALALPTLLVAIDNGVLYLALPSLSRELGADSIQQLWILDIYSFVLAGFLVTMGTLGDRVGRKRLLMIGATGFAIASVVAAFATTPELLIAARALLGIAGATLMPSTMALIRNMFPNPAQMGTAIGVWFACFMGGMLLGPIVGGFVLEHFWWGAVFLLGVPVMVVLLIVGPKLLPEYRDASAGRLDLASVALSLGAILPAVYGLKELTRHGAQPLPITAIVIGLVVGVLFVRRQRTLDDPMLDVTLFRNRAFATTIAVMFLGGVVMAGVSLVGSIYLQSVVGLSPLAAGLHMIPTNLAMVAGFLIAPRIAQRIGTTRVIAGGLGLGAAGFVLLTVIGPSDPLVLVAGFLIASFGLSGPMAVGTGVVLAAAPPEKAGSAASVNETGGEFGIALGVAALGSLATAVYRGALGTASPIAAESGALQGLADAIAAAERIGGTAGAELLETARLAFTSGVHAVGLVAIVTFALLGVAAWRVLRSVPAGEAVSEDAAEAVPEVAEVAAAH